MLLYYKAVNILKNIFVYCLIEHRDIVKTRFGIFLFVKYQCVCINQFHNVINLLVNFYE